MLGGILLGVRPVLARRPEILCVCMLEVTDVNPYTPKERLLQLPVVFPLKLFRGFFFHRTSPDS